MRLTFVALAIASVALAAGLLAQQPDRASAEYNLNGEWTMYRDGGEPCPATIVQVDSGDYIQQLQITSQYPCVLYGTFVGTIDIRSGYISARDSFPCSLGASVSDHGHALSGVVGCPGPFPYVTTWPVTLTGGSGDPKFPTPTATPCPGPCPTATATATATATPTRTPRPVGGVALDPSSNGGNPFDAWWLASIAGAAAAMLGGAATLARRRPI